MDECKPLVSGAAIPYGTAGVIITCDQGKVGPGLRLLPVCS